MDQSFVHNPAGTFAITLRQLLDPNGLHVILERFAQMIQSGRNVSLVLYKVVEKVRFTTLKKALLQAVPVLFELKRR